MYKNKFPNIFRELMTSIFGEGEMAAMSRGTDGVKLWEKAGKAEL